MFKHSLLFSDIFAVWHVKYLFSLVEVWIIRNEAKRKLGTFLNHFIKGKDPALEADLNTKAEAKWQSVPVSH